MKIGRKTDDPTGKQGAALREGLRHLMALFRIGRAERDICSRSQQPFDDRPSDSARASRHEYVLVA